MVQYTEKQIQDTLKIIESSIVNCEKVRLKLRKDSASFSLNTNRIKALYISKTLLTNQDSEYTKEELKKAFTQITSIKSKSTAGINNAKEGSATYTRFLQALDKCYGYNIGIFTKCY